MTFLKLITLSAVMASSTLLAAFFPTSLALSPRRLNIISTLGSGILLGAALTIIIPEGVMTLFESQSQTGSSEHETELSSYVGVTLLLGFILMYLIDTYSSHSHSHPPASSQQQPFRSRRGSVYLSRSTSSSELSPLRNNSTSHEFDREEEGVFNDDETTKRNPRSSFAIPLQSNSFPTVVGLLFHSLADGISLGASCLASPTSSSSSSSLDMIVFLAIMLHKAPTAFALASLLLADPSSSPLFIRNSLIAFSLASPFGAILTWLVLGLLGSEATTGEGMKFWAGLALTFSGGTFLFVATHVVKGDDHSPAHAIGGSEDEESESKLSKRASTVISLIGMCTPLVLSKLVGHGH